MSYLKKDGYVLSLCSGLSDNLESASYLSVDINLTKKGLANYEKVIEAVF
jgi:secreted Zn-dependent insulinase-like peptidase